MKLRIKHGSQSTLFIHIVSSSHKTLHNLSLHWLKSLTQSLIFFVFSFLASSCSHLVPENINQKESKLSWKFDKTYLNLCVVSALSVGWLAGRHWAWWRDSSQENVLSFDDVTILQRQPFFSNESSCVVVLVFHWVNIDVEPSAVLCGVVFSSRMRSSVRSGNAGK